MASERGLSRIKRDAVGLGLRPGLDGVLAALVPSGPARLSSEEPRAVPGGIDYLEGITENYLNRGSLAYARALDYRRRLPIALHGVSLNLMGAEPLDVDFLHRLKDLVSELDPPFVTDHLCWSAHAKFSHHDLLPGPACRSLVGYFADRIAFVAEFLGVPFGVENVSSYVAFPESDLSEWEFLVAVAEAADVGIVLDINNIWVSSKNHKTDPRQYLRAIPYGRVIEAHLAGHTILPSGILHDTHDQPVATEVWELYRLAWSLGGPFPTLLEWDASFPEDAVLLRELAKIRTIREETCV